MNDRDLLLARGWRQVGSRGRWADAGVAPGFGYDTDGAKTIQCQRDVKSAGEFGSVRYVPTAEHAQVPLLAQCAAYGMHERDVIEHLFRVHEEQRRLLLRYAELSTRPAIVGPLPPAPTDGYPVNHDAIELPWPRGLGKETP